MCGRTACTLKKHQIQRAVSEYTKTNSAVEWVAKYNWQAYKPKYNLAPGEITPVMINKSVFPSEPAQEDVILSPMRWGLIPSWYKGPISEFSMTNNCRQEGLLEKPSFRGAAQKGQRCVILADGFFEWKSTSNKQKQPYFIYFPQQKDIFCEESGNEDLDDSSNRRMLTMAGVFDTWKNPEYDVLYSYSIITLEASSTISSVHSRMPAILDGKDDVNMWLDTVRVPTKEALSMLKPVENLSMHTVSRTVNDSRNNTVDCIKPVKENDKAVKITGLTSWLFKKETGEPLAKKPKF